MGENNKEQAKTDPQNNVTPPSGMVNEANSKTGDQGTNESQENTEPSKQGRKWLSFFSLELFFDFLLIVVTCVYAGFAYKQWKSIDRQANLMSEQMESMKQSSSQTERLIKANEALAEQNRELVKTAKEQAQASQTQANAATDQAKASISQAEAAKRSVNAAQSSARAAEQTAQITRQSFYIGDRPYVAVQYAEIDTFGAGARPIISVHFINTGKTPALDFKAFAIVNVGLLPKPDLNTVAQNPSDLVYPFMPEGSEMLLPASAETYVDAQGTEVLSNVTVEEIKSGKMYLFVWGGVWYKDGLGKFHTLRFCLFYDPSREIFVACPTFNSIE